MKTKPICERKASHKGSRIFLNVCLVICIIAIVICVAYLVRLQIELHRETKLNDDLQSIYRQEEAGHESDAETDSFAKGMTCDVWGMNSALAEEVPEIEPSLTDAAALMEEMNDFMPTVEDMILEKRDLQPNFVELYERNSDTVGWITTGCGVDYPILWRDNEFYLDHDFDGASSNSGSIFLDVRDNPAMDNDCLLIYGHNMRSGIMFGDLDDYRKQKKVEEEPFIHIQSAWEPETRTYVYFSLFDASMNKDDPSYIKITNFDFETPEEKQAYLEALLERSMYDLPIDVCADDQIVCLVTCSYSHDNGRYLLFARSLREGESEESIRETLSAD